ncbi:uncharacterized protein LOC126187779 isoform X1 [Schistocerca cancellata]|uniref:uncharacterized protein LOC126187779 isoform X1 n=1 Tax=Schistocerca cancellata TaxID=274614 RepID=UPI002119012E|nr:uncharacterized protein LOC126187779 isoform X1 [Schistocerca cancellata]
MEYHLSWCGWIDGILSVRSQFIVTDRKSLSKMEVISSIAQRSTVGPLLFLMYIQGASKKCIYTLNCHRQFISDSTRLNICEKVMLCFFNRWQQWQGSNCNMADVHLSFEVRKQIIKWYWKFENVAAVRRQWRTFASKIFKASSTWE